jgi:hypothetical protein
MKVSLYLVIAQWAILFGLGFLLVVLYRQLGRVFGAKEPRKYGLPPGTLAPAFEYRRVSDGSLQHFAPGNDHPALLAFVNPTCLACDQLVDAMSGAHDQGELNAVRVLLVTSDPVSYIEISDSFKDTPLEIGQVTTRATLNSYQAVATPLIVSIGASGHISASGTTTELAELRNFVHACLNPPQIDHFSRELPLTEVNARTSRPESSSPRSEKEGADNVI